MDKELHSGERVREERGGERHVHGSKEETTESKGKRKDGKGEG